MAKRRTKGEQERMRLASQGYTECGRCRHMLKPGARKCPECGTLTASVKRSLVAVLIVATVLIAAVAIYYSRPAEEQYTPDPTVISASPTGYSASTSSRITATFNRAMDTDSVEGAFSISPSVHGTFSWSGYVLTFTPAQNLLDDSYFTVTIGGGARDATGKPLDCGSYTWSFATADLPTVRRGLGSGPADFWTVYPTTHPSAGQTVAHPDWVVAAVRNGVVLILDHSEGCYPCVQQTQICESVRLAYPGLQYFDLSSGTDEPESSQAFATYDPNGGIHYVPLTIVVTKALDGLGNEVIAWHSWEGVVDLTTLTSWVQDAQSYHAECR